MSYCVHCGVKLDHGLARCPLCLTPVVHPGAPVPDPREDSQPERIEEAISRIDLGYARQLSIFLTLIPAFVVMLLDLLDAGPPWSPYVVGALIMAWCILAVPLVFRMKRPYLYVALDVLAICGYLALIAFMGEDFSWYLHIVLPLLVLTGGITLLALLVIRRVQALKLYRAAGVFALAALFIAGLEVILDLSARGRIQLGWSIYAGIPFLVLALIAFGLEQHKGLKEEIRKRLFL